VALSTEDCKALNALFPLVDHEFTRGFVYIQERAICDRLDAVDPSWCFDLKSVQVRDNDVIVVGTLTLRQTVREGVGMAKIVEKGAEAEKSAATDALKRAARLFGVGRYLLSAPEEKQFAGWLAKLTRGDAPIEPPRQAEAPAPNGWTRDQASSLGLEAKRLNVSTDELLALLNVAKLSEYAPGFSAARDNLQKYAKARPPMDAAPATEVVF
jgi:hypothetical protein